MFQNIARNFFVLFFIFLSLQEIPISSHPGECLTAAVRAPGNEIRGNLRAIPHSGYHINHWFYRIPGVIGTTGGTLEEAVIDLLKEKDLKLSLAESLTGGMIAQRIVNVSGASEVFGYGFVTYSNKAKHKCLGVKKRTLKEQGAVSAKCAREMAKGACKASGADISISVTGLAGPGGGTKETPVGTVFMGCCYKGKAIAKEFHFTGNRMRIREQTTAHALAMLRDCIIMSR